MDEHPPLRTRSKEGAYARGHSRVRAKHTPSPASITDMAARGKTATS